VKKYLGQEDPAGRGALKLVELFKKTPTLTDLTLFDGISVGEKATDILVFTSD
jgi:hypothetical protein